MGTDNLHHKRKARLNKSIGRKPPHRPPYDRVLIVCEGAKTEPNYFDELIKHFRLINVKNLKIEIIGDDCGSAPITIVELALKKNKESDDYDRIFCVFDKDNHTSYNEAIDKIKRARLKPGHSIQAINSIPCFEFWILLHFEYTTAPFSATGKDSICHSLIKNKLCNHIPEYDKGKKEMVQRIIPKLDTAIKHAKMIETYHKTSGTDNPSTKVHILVEYLQNITK